MKRVAISLAALLLAAIVVCAPAQAASFGLKELGVSFVAEEGVAPPAPGSHGFVLGTSFGLNTIVAPTFGELPAEMIKDLSIDTPLGLAGNPTATPRCSAEDFIDIDQVKKLPACSNDSAVGVALLHLKAQLLEETEVEGHKTGEFQPTQPEYIRVPVYNLVPSPGEAAKLGFIALGVPVTVDLRVSQVPPYRIVASLNDISQALTFFSSTVYVWGNPRNSIHDPLRGNCVNAVTPTAEPEFLSVGNCPASPSLPETPFLTASRACLGPLAADFTADSWLHPGAFAAGSALSTDGGEPPQTFAFEGCSKLGFDASIASEPTSRSAESETGLNFDLNIDQQGLSEPEGAAAADLKKAVVTLPEGMTTNPAIAAGLTGCTLGEYRSTSMDPNQGGCPGSSKVGTVEVETPLLQKEASEGGGLTVLRGAIYVAQQTENEFHSLLNIYMVIREPRLGILIRLAGKVEPDPTTGQLTTTFEELPQLPFSHFHLHFRDGERAPLITPSTCGTYTTQADLYPYSHPDTPVRQTASFTIAGACAASAGQLPHAPGFSAGTLDPKAGTYSPLVLRLSRPDGSQRFSSISTTLPQGLLGKLAGIPYCPDSAIAQAAARTGEGQGALELAQPSCPVGSEVGTVTVGAGAGATPYYVQGRAYLAGPYKGAPLSLEIITPAIAGPFDLGVVAVRTALQVDLRTAQVTAVSDPLPTILFGLPLDVRSIVIDMRRPEFILNPTDCEPKTILGSTVSTVGAVADLSQYFQASDCRSLKFHPKVKLQLKGATKRSGHPALKAVVSYPKEGAYANIARAQVGLPHSEFLDQGNLDKVCTQPELKSDRCPATSVYGHAKAWTPLLDRPLEGPVYLGVGFGYKLPALVADLNGQIRILLVGRIDTTKQNGIRSTFEAVPDAPVSKFVLEMKGGKKYGLLQNSENTCRKVQRASARFAAQNGLTLQMRPKIDNRCGKKHKKQSKGHKSPPRH